MLQRMVDCLIGCQVEPNGGLLRYRTHEIGSIYCADTKESSQTCARSTQVTNEEVDGISNGEACTACHAVAYFVDQDERGVLHLAICLAI